MRNDTLLRTVSEQLVNRHEQLSPVQVSHSVYGLCKFHFNEDEGKTLGMLTGEARRRMWEYSIDDLAQILSSLSRVRVKNQGFVTRLVERITPEQLETCTSRSVVNLMTGLSRNGVRSTRRADPWSVLADELTLRVEHESSLSVDDKLAALIAYAYPHVGHAHEGLFSSVSKSLASTLSREQIFRYVKACARVQHRDVTVLALCASCLRSDPALLSGLPSSDLVELYSGLDKLGAEMKDLTALLENRGVSLPTVVKPTWFRQPRPVTKRRQKTT